MERKHRLRFVSDITKDIWKQIYSCKDGILDYDGWGFLWSCGFAAGLWRWTVEPEVSLHSDYLSLTRTTLRAPPRGFVVYGLLLRAMFVGKGFTVLLSFSFAMEWAKIVGYWYYATPHRRHRRFRYTLHRSREIPVPRYLRPLRVGRIVIVSWQSMCQLIFFSSL